MWPFKKKKRKVKISKKKIGLGPKAVNENGCVETIMFSYRGPKGIKYTGVGNITFPLNVRLSDFLATTRNIALRDVKFESGESYSALGIKKENLIFICLGWEPEPKIRQTYPIEFTLGGYGPNDQSCEKVGGRIVLISPEDLENKIKNTFVAVRDFKRSNGEKYPVGLISSNYIHDYSMIGYLK